MISLPRLASTVFAALALAACGGAGDEATGGESENSRILEGSVSDEMIPFEKLRSEPPAAKIEAGEGKAGAAGTSGSRAGSSQASGAGTADPAQAAPAEPAERPATDSPDD
ncbi:MAG: hypothetical protein FJX31_12510 [Alphaproteobacteria bacterium]|nr:hypothetical protein [Alphaproteobacteria bacterium]